MSIKTKMYINLYVFVIIAIMMIANEFQANYADDLRDLLRIPIAV